MGIDVVGHDEVDLAMFGNDPVRDLFSEVVVDDLDAGIIDGRNHVGGGIDADHRADTLVRQRPQQDAVVAAELEHGCLAGIEKPLRDFGGIFPEMVPQRADRRGEIEIIPEHDVGRYLVGHLHRAALPAEMQPHWKRAFGRELLRLQERAGEANLAEIHPVQVACCRRKHRRGDPGRAFPKILFHSKAAARATRPLAAG